MSHHYFITGVSSGIGEALVRRLCHQGHKVTGLARRETKLQNLEDEFAQFHGIVCDVTDKQAVLDAAQNAEKHHGDIDVVIPNAGIYNPQAPHVIDSDEFQRHMDVNYMAVIYCLAATMPQMIARGRGHIALMASVAGYRGLPRSSAYGPTKAAIINLAEALRFDLDGSGVKLQLICPGFVETEATAVNDFDMPDIISADKAATFIIDGMRSSKFEIAFPKSFARKMKWLTLMPTDVYFNLIRRITSSSKR